MKKQSLLSISTFAALLLLLAFALTGCGNRPTPTPESTQIPPTPEATATATAAPNRIVLFDPNGVAGAELTGMLTEFAAANAITLETSITLPDNYEGVKIMLLFGKVDGFEDLAASAPQTQFVAASQTVSPSANISLLAADPTQLAFMAGYLAAMTSKDWRAGALLVDDSGLGLADAFANGGQYLCGNCTPQFTPMLYYPQVYPLAGSSDTAAWTAQATALWSETSANSIFIDRAGDIPAVLDQFPEARLYGNDPNSPNLARYTAILGAEVTPALLAALPELLGGNGGKTLQGRISLVVINNPEVITPGKLARFNEISQALADNQIIPLSIP